MFSFGPQTTVEIWFEDPVSDKDYHHLGPQTGPLLKYQQQWGCSLAFKCLVSRGEKSRKRFRPYTWPRATEHFQSQNWSWKFIWQRPCQKVQRPACLPVLYGANLPPKCTTPWMNIQSFSFLAAKICETMEHAPRIAVCEWVRCGHVRNKGRERSRKAEKGSGKGPERERERKEKGKGKGKGKERERERKEKGKGKGKGKEGGREKKGMQGAEPSMSVFWPV